MRRALSTLLAISCAGCSALLDLGALQNGGHDGGDAGQPTLDAGSDGGVDAGSDGGRDGGRDAGPSDAGPEPLGPGLVLTAGGAGAELDRLVLAADTTQLCVGGDLEGASATVDGVTLTGGAGPTPWIACYDLEADGPRRRYVRALTSEGASVGALALDDAGALYVLGRITPGGERRFDGHMVYGLSYLARLTRDGEVTDARSLASETEYPTGARIEGTTLYATTIDFYGNSAAVTRVDLTSFALVETRYLTTGWHAGIDVRGDELVFGVLEAGGRAVVHRGPAPDLTPLRWTRESVGAAGALAGRLDGDGNAFIAADAAGPFQWTGATTVLPGTAGDVDAVVTRFAPSGDPSWVTRPVAAPGGEHVAFLELDADGAPIVGGSSAALVAPSGLEPLPSLGGTRESWIVRLDAVSGDPVAWERVESSVEVLFHGAVIQDGWLYVAGTFSGMARAASSDALGASGLAAVGARDAFVARFPIP